MSAKRKTLSVLFALVLALSFSLVTATPARAANRTASVTGLWSNTATWGDDLAPTSVDDVEIEAGITVTVDIANAVCLTLLANESKPGTATLSFNSGSKLTIGTTLTVGGNAADELGSINMNSGGTLQIGTTVTIGQTGGTWTPGTGTVDYNGAAQTLPTTWMTTYNNLTLSGSGVKTTTGVTVNGILSMEGNGTVTASAVPTYGVAATLQYKGSATQTTGTEFPATFGGGGGVIINNATGVNLNSSPTISGTLTLTSGIFSVGGNTLTLDGPTIAGVPANLSTTSSSSLVFGGISSGVNIPSSVTALNNLTINNANGVTLNSSPTISGTLTLTNGNITTGVNTVIISPSGSVSRTSGYVVGNLQKYVGTGAQSPAFEVGTTSNYNPVTVAFNNVTVAGNLIAKVTSGEHPNITSSAIDSSKDVNAYWTFTNSGITFDNYDATFTFVPGDVDVGANTTAFIVGRYSSGWTYPTVGTRTSTSTQATGVTSLSDYAVGESVTWDSYNDAAHQNQDDLFNQASEDTVYMYGGGFEASAAFHVAYYDAASAKLLSDGVSSNSTGNLSSQCYFPTYQESAVAGTWHAVVYKDSVASPAENYTANDPNSVVEDSFEVTAEAIPEFPTVIAGIAVAGMCFGIYYWMRKRKLAYVKA